MIKEEEEEEVANGGGTNCLHQHRRLPDVFKESDDLETLGSLERDLPVELSFVIRQQAYCMARMNYLDRQIRELKESTKNNTISSNNNPTATSSRNGTSSSYQSQQQHLYQQQQLHHHLQNQINLNQRAGLINNNGIPSTINNIPVQCNSNQFVVTSNANNLTATTSSKNGNFIPSDDSGGEYSRATISDDDELSSLLDQIAKSVKPPIDTTLSNQHVPQMQIPIQSQLAPIQRTQYNVIATNHHQPYAIFNPMQTHHHQAVPVFVMGSPITTTSSHNPSSSISSTILPGVHFQPEPRYNQYYAAEDFYVQQNPLTSTNIMMNTPSSSTNRHNSTGLPLNGRSRQFDSSLSAIEQLVSQKEKRQVKSQLKSADNWLKMRASGLYSNLNEFNNQSTSSISGGVATLVSASVPISDNNGQMVTNNGGGGVVDKNSRTSTSSQPLTRHDTPSVSDLNQQVSAGRSR